MSRHKYKSHRRPPKKPRRSKKGKYKYKFFKFPSGRIVDIQGYEHHALQDLLTSGIDEKDIIVGMDLIPIIRYEYRGRSRKYYPDIFIISQHLLIEVKSAFTLNRNILKNDSKFNTACESHNFEVWVYNDQGVREQSIVYTPNHIFIFREQSHEN
jgi:hypothetical protein